MKINTMNKLQFVDLSEQHRKIRKEIDSAIKRVIDYSDFILGEEVELFEREFANYCQVKYCIGVASGTAALHMSLVALGIDSGDEVITTPLTFMATVEPVIWLGAKPVLVDIDERTYNINPDLIEEKITKKTKAIICVHLYGQSCEMESLKKIAKKHKLFLIEDCAQAHGAKYKGKMVGGVGDVGCFSFFPAKNLGCFGDGGAVVTNNIKIDKKVRLLRNHGRREKYKHLIVGYGERLDTLQAAVLRVKLKYLDKWNEKRRQNAYYFNRLLRRANVVLPFEDKNMSSVYYVYSIRVKNRDKLKKNLEKMGIPTNVYYPKPLHLQPALEFLDYAEGSFPVSEKVCKEIISLPIYPELSKKKIKMIAEAVVQFIE